ncbi:hypothetical protein [Thalassotalea ganghwensis]
MRSLTLYFMLLCISLLLISCSEGKKTNSTLVDPTCIASQSQCQFDTPFGTVSVLFNRQKILTEEPFKVLIKNSIPKNLLIIDGFLEGKTMYMGKIPLLFSYDQTKQLYIAETMVGSCSVEHMTWVMHLTLKTEHSANNQDVQISVEFESERL